MKKQSLFDKEMEIPVINDEQEAGERLLIARKIEKGKCEFEGPFECPRCEGHIMLDGTFLDQVSEIVMCPYCHYLLSIPE